jgi:hypothetical protein
VTISEELSLDTLLRNPPGPLLNHSDNQAALEEEELRSAETVGNFAHSAVLDLNFVSGAPEGSDLVPFAPLPTRGHTPTISPADKLLSDLDSRRAISETPHTTPTSSLSSIPSPDSEPVDSAQPSSFPNEPGITCAWLGCQKVFSTVSDYKSVRKFPTSRYQTETDLSSHRCKSHIRPHQCSACRARFANKRHLDRHVNECHTYAEKYYCPVATCKRSKASGKMLPFYARTIARSI